MVMGPWKPYITKMNLKSGSKVNYDFDGFFKEIWIDAQVRNKNIIIGWIHSIDSNIHACFYLCHISESTQFHLFSYSTFRSTMGIIKHQWKI